MLVDSAIRSDLIESCEVMAARIVNETRNNGGMPLIDKLNRLSPYMETMENIPYTDYAPNRPILISE